MVLVQNTQLVADDFIRRLDSEDLNFLRFNRGKDELNHFHKLEETKTSVPMLKSFEKNNKNVAYIPMLVGCIRNLRRFCLERTLKCQPDAD